MKADIAYCLSVELGHPHAFVGLTGVANTNQYLRALEELKRFGVKKIKVAFDMDAFTNENVMQARERVLNKGYEAGLGNAHPKHPTTTQMPRWNGLSTQLNRRLSTCESVFPARRAFP